MSVETATYISELTPAAPSSSDSVSQGDDHIRLLKAVLQAQFPNLGAAAITPTAVELNYVDGVTSAIQTQFAAKAPTASPTFTGTVTAAAANFSGNVDFATFATAPTEVGASNNTRLATTEFVQTAVAGATGGISRAKMYFWGNF